MIVWKVICATIFACGVIEGQWFPVQFESPTYTPLAAQAQIEGEVRIRLVLGSDGHVDRATVISGNKVLAGAARAHALSWRFASPCPNLPADSAIDFRYLFKLHGSTAEKPAMRWSYKEPHTVTIVSQAQRWVPSRSGGGG